MKKRFTDIIKTIRKKLVKYISTNRLFITFVIFSLIETILLRGYTLKNTFDYKPIICDLALLVIIGSFGYFIKPKKQFNYYFIWMLIITLMCVVNSIYYVFYTSFASFSLLAELGLVGQVGDSVIEKLKINDFVYLILPFSYFLLHSSLKKGSYYFFITKVENSKKMFCTTILTGVIILAFTLVNITGTDISRLVKQWNREYIVQRFGIVLYQGNDLIQSLSPKINSLFGYDEAAKGFKDFYTERFEKESYRENQYTNIFKGKNVIFIHLESIQNFLIDTEVNGEQITPTINRLSKEGMYFNNFYPQISVGTSSDTEFTLNTSMMPVSSGTVFVSYANRNYVSTPKLLSEMGYYTFSSHANGSSMWNRSKMHPTLGYQEMYFKDTFEVEPEDEVGLGLNDVSFFEQLQSKLEKIETEHENYMGTLIQLSNHSPFGGTDVNPEIYNSLGELDLTNTYTVVDNNDKETTVTDDYLKDTKLGNYFISAHYADLALGTFIDYIENSEYYDNTIFVLYGDHDAKLDKKEYQYYYNYDKETGKVLEEDDENYRVYDSFAHDLNKNTPLIIWTKNKQLCKRIRGTYSNVMGMYDVMPTIGNMFGFRNKYALGHDIFDIGDNNVVVFPSGNFLTNKVYYNNTAGTYMVLNNANNNESVVIGEDYISDYKTYAEKILSVSNDMIVHDLIEKEGSYFDSNEKGDN